MSSKGKQRMVSSLGREFSVALEGSIAAGKDAAVRDAEKARDYAQAAAKQSSKDKLAIAAMLEEHALETRGVVGRGVMLCAGIALLELVPLLLWLYIALFG